MFVCLFVRHFVVFSSFPLFHKEGNEVDRQRKERETEKYIFFGTEKHKKEKTRLDASGRTKSGRVQVRTRARLWRNLAHVHNSCTSPSESDASGRTKSDASGRTKSDDVCAFAPPHESVCVCLRTTTRLGVCGFAPPHHLWSRTRPSGRVHGYGEICTACARLAQVLHKFICAGDASGRVRTRPSGRSKSDPSGRVRTHKIG